MSDTEQTNPSTDNASPAGRKSGLGRKIFIGAGALVVIAGIGVAAAVGSGFHHKGHWGKHGMMRDFAEWRMEKVLDEVDASADQKTKIKALFETTFDEVRPQPDQFKAMRDQMTTILKAPTVDKAAIEKMRVERVAEMDAKSKVIAKAIGDAADILTPEQRVKLVDQFEQMRKDRDDQP